MCDQISSLRTEQIWVIGELSEDYKYTSQLISKGRKLADRLEKQLVVIEFSSLPADMAERYKMYGADIILDICSKKLDMGTIKDVCCHLIKEKKPKLIMGCSNNKNKELFSRIATKLNLGLTADIIEIILNYPDDIIFQRAAINSSTIANIESVHKQMQLCTVKKDVFSINECNSYICRKEVIKYELKEKEKVDTGIRLFSKKIRSSKDEKCGIKSHIVLGVGKGAIESIDKINVLSNKLNADIGVTRSLVEMKLYEHKQQIGQSGYSIDVEVYIAFGISGAVQHLVGLKNVSYIIAVNRDQNAPIFKYADLAIVADVESVCEDLLNNIKR